MDAGHKDGGSTDATGDGAAPGGQRSPPGQLGRRGACFGHPAVERDIRATPPLVQLEG